MRTTVTLDPDVELLLKKEANRSQRSFKAVLNEAIRRQLGDAGTSERFVVKSRDMGLRAGLDPARLTEVADDLELEAFLETTRRLERSAP
jgi:hypothetical protein